MSMVRWSCSLPQTLELGVQAEMKPSAIPVPFLKTLPDCAVTCTRTVWFWLVHPTCVDPKPLAIWLPERSVRLTSTKADRAPAHSIWTVRSAPAPLATSVAGEFTWISSRSGGEKKPPRRGGRAPSGDGRPPPDDAEIGEYLQVAVVVKRVAPQGAARADPAQGPVPGPTPATGCGSIMWIAAAAPRIDRVRRGPRRLGPYPRWA